MTKHLLASTLALSLVWLAGPALGQSYDYTPLQGPAPGEASHLQIISDIYAAYGGTWVADDLDFNNGAGITVKRVYDSDDQDIALHILSGDETDVDQLWTDGVVTVTAEAKYAYLDQSFGWNGGVNNVNPGPTDYIELLTDDDVGGDPEVINITGDFLWGSHATRPPCPTGGYYWWSQNDLNADDMDHMMTYFVEGLPDAAPGEAVWLLFWEDLTYDDIPPSDQDYNDFVIEVRAIPEPGTLVLVAAGLTALAASRRRHLTS